jgi:hypothetical protein
VRARYIAWELIPSSVQLKKGEQVFQIFKRGEVSDWEAPLKVHS